MRPAGQPYSSWPEAVYSRRSPPPTLTDKTVEKLALRIRAFLQWKDAGVAYRGGSVGDKDVHVGGAWLTSFESLPARHNA